MSTDRESLRLTTRMLQSLDAYWLTCDGLPKGRYPRGKYDAEEWFTRFERYRGELTSLLAARSPFPVPTMRCECGKTSNFCDNGLCWTWTSRFWRWLRGADPLGEGER